MLAKERPAYLMALICYIRLNINYKSKFIFELEILLHEIFLVKLEIINSQIW